MTMIFLWSAVLALFAIGTIGIIVPIIPSVPLVWAGVVVYAWATHFSHVSMTVVVITGIIALGAIAVDFFSGMLGAKAYGASWRGMLGAVIGGFCGMIIFSIVGMIVGTMLGAFCGEYFRWRTLAPAARASIGTVVGFLVNVVAQFFFTALIIGIFLAAVLW